MFAPPDYMRFCDLSAEIGGWAEKIADAHAYEIRGEPPRLAFDRGHFLSPFIITLKKPEICTFELDRPLQDGAQEPDFQTLPNYHKLSTRLLQHSVLGLYLNYFPPLLCSPHGTLMQGPEQIFMHADVGAGCPWGYPSWRTFDYHPFFPPNSRDFNEYDPASRYLFVDGSTGLVRQEDWSMNYLETYGPWRQNPKVTQLFFETAVMPYLGWSLVWPDWWEEEVLFDLFSEVGAVPERWNLKNYDFDFSEPKQAKRRGRRPNKAKAEYYERYPNGKPDDVSYEAIAAELSDAGFSVSERSLQTYETERKKSL